MGILQSLRNKIFGVQIIEGENPYETENYGDIVKTVTLSSENAYALSKSVAELFFPIDFHADRISKLRFYIADENGVEIQNSQYDRLIKKINPLYSINDLIYQYVFSLLADGSAITYRKIPSLYKKATINTIDRVDVLEPDTYGLNEYTNVSELNINSFNELVKEIYMCANGKKEILNIDNVIIDNYGRTKRSDSNVLSLSTLFQCKKSIDNLLAVYSARFNVYNNNGCAGYISKKSSSNNGSLESVLDSDSKERIMRDINDRNGITGSRNLWGISGVPIEFVNTLSSIQSLQPFDETFENAIKIAGVYQIPPELVPRKDQGTFNNKAEAEKSVWENSLLSLIGLVEDNWTKILMLDTVNLKFKADLTTVSHLQEKKIDKEDYISKKLDNLEKLKISLPSKENEINALIENIISEYGSK